MDGWRLVTMKVRISNSNQEGEKTFSIGGHFFLKVMARYAVQTKISCWNQNHNHYCDTPVAGRNFCCLT